MKHTRYSSTVIVLFLMTFLVGCGPKPTVYKTIYEATAAGDLDNVKLHVKNGTDVNARDDDGITALMVAAMCSHPELISYLISKGARIDARTDSKGYTALHLATRVGNLNTVKLLVEGGADVNTTVVDLTPLDVASMDEVPNGSEIMAYLSQHGARHGPTWREPAENTLYNIMVKKIHCPVCGKNYEVFPGVIKSGGRSPSQCPNCGWEPNK